MLAYFFAPEQNGLGIAGENKSIIYIEKFPLAGGTCLRYDVRLIDKPPEPEVKGQKQILQEKSFCL